MMFIHGSSWLFQCCRMITKLVICFFSSLALLCDCSACIHQQFKGCSLKFVLYHGLLLHLTRFCRRGSKRKLHFESDLSFLGFTPLFPSCSPSKVFSLYTGKGFLQLYAGLCFGGGGFFVAFCLFVCFSGFVFLLPVFKSFFDSVFHSMLNK